MSKSYFDKLTEGKNDKRESYFLTDEKVCKESPGTFRMVPGLPRRPKGKADWICSIQHFFRFPP